MRLEAAARMDLFRKLWKARKLIVVVFIPLSLLPLPLIHPTSVSTSKIKCFYNYKYRNINLTFAKKVMIFKIRAHYKVMMEFKGDSM